MSSDPACDPQHDGPDEPGRLEWDPGSLSTLQQDRMLTDLLADIWMDTYRQGQSETEHWRLFDARVEKATRHAAGRAGRWERSMDRVPIPTVAVLGEPEF